MDGQFIQMSSVALHLHQGTVRETMVTVLYALDSVGNVWKLIDSRRAEVDADDQRAVRRALAQGRARDPLGKDSLESEARRRELVSSHRTACGKSTLDLGGKHAPLHGAIRLHRRSLGGVYEEP